MFFTSIIGRVGASPPSRTTGPRCVYKILLGERERAHLVVQLGRAVCIYIVFMCIYIYPVGEPDTVNF